MGQIDRDHDWITAEQALKHLEVLGILPYDGGTIQIPSRRELSRKTWSAITYLTEEWGFAWEWDYADYDEDGD